MLAVLGDLLEDIVVLQREPATPASDTAAHITRRPGGSASNVARVAAQRGAEARFIGQVGDDDVGRALVGELSAAGADTSPVRFAGTTGTIVVLVDQRGERTMFTDRRACVGLDRPDPEWLDRVDALHVPFYSLAEPPISDTATTTIAWARDRGILVSIDASSESVLRSYGLSEARSLLERLAPDVVFANEDEARVLGIDAPVAGALTVVKRGAEGALLHLRDGSTIRTDALTLDSVPDTTGAGDAFAAGFLTYRVSEGRRDGPLDGPVGDPVGACRAGHEAAAALLRSR